MWRNFSQTYQNGRPNSILTTVELNESGGGRAPDGSVPYHPNCQALWDTGATGTCISKTLAAKLGLTPVGFVEMHTASGKVKCRRFHISIKLPNRIYIEQHVVSEADLPNHIDCLIGMDLITQGDFRLEATEGTKYKFSFSIKTGEKVKPPSNPVIKPLNKAAKKKRNNRKKIADKSRKRNRKK